MSPTSRQNLKMVAIAVAASLATASAPAIAHGVRHALFAHKAGVAKNAKKLGGKKPSAYQPAHKRIRVVQAGTNATTNGAAFRKVVNSTVGTAANPFVIKLEPGTYTLTSPLRLKEFVDIEGSGRRATIIRCACGAATNTTFGTATVLWAQGATTERPLELRHLSVEGTGSQIVHALVFNEFNSPRLTDVMLKASGATAEAGAMFSSDTEPVIVDSHLIGMGATFNVGFEGDGSGLTLRDSHVEAHGPPTANGGQGVRLLAASEVLVDGSTIDASGEADSYWGLLHSGDDILVRDSSITADGVGFTRALQINSTGSAEVRDTRLKAGSDVLQSIGLNVLNGTVGVHHSALEGATDGFVASAGATVRLATSQLINGSSGAGTKVCFGVYDAVFAIVPAGC